MELGNITVFDVIIILGALQGIFFSLYLMFNPLANKKANLFLWLFIFSFSCCSLFYLSEGLGLRGNLNVWDFSPLFCSLAILPSFYYFIHFLIYPHKDYTLEVLLMFVPFFIQFGFQVWGLLMNFIDRGRVFDYEERIYAFYNQTDIFLLVFGIGILMITIIKIRKYEIRLKNNFAEIGEYSLQWLHNLIFVLFGIWILFLIPTVYEVITGSSPMNIYYPVWIATSALIYWIGYSTYLKQHNSVSLDLEQSETQRNHKLSQNTNTYHRDLLALMEHEKPYLNQDLTLKLLADKLDLSSGYLSQIINQFEGKNFFDFINSYRVASVKEKIQNPDYAHFNLLGIAFDSGFKSKSTFNLSFKKLTGKTPSGFKKSWETSRDKNKTS